MATITYESALVEGEYIEPGLLIWRRYRVPAPRITELFMDVNPHIRAHMKQSIYLPLGVPVLIPIDEDIINGRPQSVPTTRFWGTAEPMS